MALRENNSITLDNRLVVAFDEGTNQVTIALDGVTILSASTSALDLLSGATIGGTAPLPTSGMTGVLEFGGDGAPDASAQASKDINPTGDDNGLTFTAVEYGTGGNDITIEYVNPGISAALSVSVSGKAITVNLATDGSAAITSTAADVLAAIEASAEASALVTVAIMTSDTGVADDGSGLVTALGAANLINGAGVGVGSAGTGSRYTDTTNGVLYLNTGDATQPVWGALAAA